MTEGSLFAGIMGFGEGFRRAGFRNLWAVEKEQFCRAVIKTRFPETEIFNDVRECGKHNLGAVDVLTAGFPCQDLSVAGKRAGLEGSRSGLFWEVVRILGELKPTWFVLENVPGLFSSREGRDFAIVLNALDELGYGLAWRVLNSQFFGVAQRRRRVFIVGYFGGPCPAEVLFEPEGSGGNFAQSGEARADIAVPLTSGLGVSSSSAGRRCEDDFNLAVGYHENLSGNVAESNIARAQRSGASHSYQFVAATLPADHRFTTNSCVDNLQPIANALSSSAGHHGHSSPRGDGSDNIIVQQAISSKWAKGSSGSAGDEHHNLIAIQDVRGYRDKKQNGIGIDENCQAMYTLDGTSQHAVAMPITGHSGWRGEDRDTYIPCSDAQHEKRSSQQFDSAREVDGAIRRDDAECAPANSHGMRTFTGLPEGMDSARYRALGNAVTVSVAEWIARRILACEKRLSDARRSREENR